MQNPNNLPHKKNNKEILLSIASTGFAILACCFVISIIPFGFADGSFPSAEYHILIRDEDGNPVSGAVLSVRLRGENTEAFGYPFDNYTATTPLVSNDEGLIVVQHLMQGIEFGGGFTIFSVLFETDVPVFVCTVTSTGYEPIRFTTKQLFSRTYEDDAPDGQSSITVDSEQVTLDVYNYVLVLEQH